MLVQLFERVLPHVAGVSNRVVDFYLKQDADYVQDLQTLSRKTIVFLLTDLSLQVQLHFSRTKLRIHYQFTRELDDFDLFLSGSSLNLLAFAVHKVQRSKLLSEGRIKFQGDLFLLEALAHLFSEREFLDHVPLPMSVKSILLKTFRSGFAWQKHNLQVVQKSLVDYVQEELKLLPSGRHFEFLQDDLFLLGQAVDRLEAWVNELNRES